jgi:hypothetical protein
MTDKLRQGWNRYDLSLKWRRFLQKKWWNKQIRRNKKLSYKRREKKSCHDDALIINILKSLMAILCHTVLLFVCQVVAVVNAKKQIV